MEKLIHDIARRIKVLRQSKGLRQVELSDQIGLSYRHFQKLEAGEVDFRASTIARLASSLGVCPSRLIADAQDQIPRKLSHAMKVGRIGFFYAERNQDRVAEVSELEEILGVDLGPDPNLARERFLSHIPAQDRIPFEGILTEFDQGHLPQYDYEFRFNSPARGQIWLRLFSVVERRDASGKPACHIGFCQDITSWKAAAEAETLLEEINSRTRLLISANRSEVSLDADKRIEILQEVTHLLSALSRAVHVSK